MHANGLRLVLAGAMFLTAAAAHEAAGAAAARKWPTRKDGADLVVETPHYVVKTDLGPDAVQVIAIHQEVLFAELLRRMGDLKPRQVNQRLNILVVGTEKRYLAEVGKDAKGSQGIFVPPKNLLACWGEADNLDAILKTLRHEGTHQFVQLFIGNACPVWLNEGLASLYEYGRFDGVRLEVEVVAGEYIAILKQAVQKKELVPVSKILTMTDEEWLRLNSKEGKDGPVRYAEAWGLVYFLAYGEGGKFRGPFQQYIAQVARGQRATRAWETTFGTDYAGLEARLTAWIRSSKADREMDCRGHLYILGTILWTLRERKDLWPDIETFRRAILSVPKFTDEDKKEMAALFHCELDKRPADTISYELAPPPGAGPPVLRCRHHLGVVLETVYNKEAGEGEAVKIVSRPATSAPPGKTKG